MMPLANPREFLPAIVRLSEQPPSPLGRALLTTILVFLALLIAWAAIGRLDVVAVAEGKLVPSTYLKIVQPTDAGVVKEILVREGESVKAGQLLMRMDPTLANSDLKALTADAHNKRLAVRRIDAELTDGRFASRLGDPAELFAQVNAQYIANRVAYENALAQERATLDKAKHDLASTKEIRAKLAETLPHFRNQEASYAGLERDGFVGALASSDKKRERIEREQDLRAQEDVVASAGATLVQEERKIVQIGAEYQRRLRAERIETAAQLERVEQELAKQEHRGGWLEMKAPANGIVKDLATHTAGTVASPGTILMTLVPTGESLLAEVWVKNDDIGFVRERQPVRLKLAAFPFQQYGMVDGDVLQVSADSSDPANAASTAPGPAARPGGEVLAYRALVNLRSQQLSVDGRPYALAPGMQVAAEIHLGTRSVLEYLLSPVTRGFREAGRER
ncbi:MAG: HlyD family type I secretion periplasmic adaptor subunit [Caulobacter sp.]|nr:HlyD family type I secretion periplasmic adaptor subunit [Vitreoscilla sp.]